MDTYQRPDNRAGRTGTAVAERKTAKGKNLVREEGRRPGKFL